MNVTDILNELRHQRDQLQRAINAIEGSASRRKLGRPTGSGGKRRTMSTEARAKIAKAARARWAAARKAGRKNLAA